MQSPNRARSGELKIEEAVGSPTMPAGFRQVGTVTRITGKLTDYVTITLPIPAGVDAEQIPNLRVMRHDGRSWGAVLPEQIDLQQRLVKVTTNQFSL